MAVTVGCPPRSTDVRLPSLSRLTRAHRARFVLGSRSSLGNSRAIEYTFLSAMVSLPVHWKLFSNPSKSAKNGELRTLHDHRWLGIAGPLTGGQTDGRYLVPVVVACREHDAEGDVGPQIAVGVDVDAVDRVRVQALPHARGERIDVHDEDAPTGVVRCLKGEQIGEVEATVPTRRLELRAGEMIGHGYHLPLGGGLHDSQIPTTVSGPFCQSTGKGREPPMAQPTSTGANGAMGPGELTTLTYNSPDPLTER